jgi:hypothetical protein
MCNPSDIVWHSSPFEGIIFVALMKQYVLKDRLFSFQWVGVVFNVVSVFMVGCTAILSEGVKANADGGDSSSAELALLGVLLVMLGALVQAMVRGTHGDVLAMLLVSFPFLISSFCIRDSQQFVFEEKVLTMDIPSPPLLLIGMEGLWGTIICLVVVYPLVYLLPGDDHGSYEDPFNTWHMFVNERHIQIAFIVYFFSIFGYNFFAVLVTYLLNSVWHAILDNFRPITVWITDLFIYYVISTSFGEQWTVYSWIQVAGMFVLLYGTGELVLKVGTFHFNTSIVPDESVFVQLSTMRQMLEAFHWKASGLHLVSISLVNMM